MYIMFCFWFPYIINLKILFIAYMDFRIIFRVHFLIKSNFSSTPPQAFRAFIGVLKDIVQKDMTYL